MKKLLLLSITALTLTAGSVFAASAGTEPKPTPAPMEHAGPGGEMDMHHEEMHHEWTLQEARKHAHEMADKLDKMTEAEWAEHQKKRREFKEKIHNMSPEERKEFFKNIHEKHMRKHDKDAGGAAPAGSAPAATDAPAEKK
ncbi:MAG TPA: hypothetical protein VFT64_00875 [Rickettsiales bacterium]|nr:hypothetical protein [Rickettsiales bacterium]